MKSVKDIKDIMTAASDEEICRRVADEYKSDNRKSVQAALKVLEKKLDYFITEKERMVLLNSYERELHVKGYKTVAGVDEVGRGPLAGPVVACAVILPPGAEIFGVDDSKKLTPAKRAKLFWQIYEKAIDIGIGIIDIDVILEKNILNATHMAMMNAIMNMKTRPEFVIVDGNSFPMDVMPNKAIVNGDQKSISIASASIIAKEVRDEMMYMYSKEYPEYGFDVHKGYGTKRHIEALKKYGPCKIHRAGFIKNFV